MIRVLLADDEHLLRSSLAALLDFEDDLTVVGQAHCGAEAVRLAAEIRPDVVVTDLDMPTPDGADALDGLGVVTALARDLPNLPTVLLTRHARPGVLKQALAAGVRGFASKSVDPDELATIIRTVHSGRRYIDPEISSAALVNDCPLTERELDALRAAADGATVREVADRLHLAQGTVRNYLSQAMAKTGADTRHSAARIALARGWL